MSEIRIAELITDTIAAKDATIAELREEISALKRGMEAKTASGYGRFSGSQSNPAPKQVSDGVE